MLSGYWQHACCYGYLRCLGWFSCFEMCDTICVTGIYLSLQYAALKGGYNVEVCTGSKLKPEPGPYPRLSDPTRPDPSGTVKFRARTRPEIGERHQRCPALNHKCNQSKLTARRQVRVTSRPGCLKARDVQPAPASRNEAKL